MADNGPARVYICNKWLIKRNQAGQIRVKNHTACEIERIHLHEV